MDIRKFEARTMKEALNRVRAELGPEAVILQSRELTKRRLLGLARTQSIEITAATGVQLQERPTAPQASSEDQITLKAIGEGIRSLEELVHDLCRRKRSPSPDLPVELAAVYTKLLGADVHEAIASDLVCRLRDAMTRAELEQPAQVKQQMTELVRSRMHVSGPIVCEHGQCKVVALVGPTGAGKTCTVAKLAANFKLRQNLRVGLVTVDTYRIAAVEQLRTYAEIMDLPIRIVSSPREMSAAVGELKDVDLVLIDTAGRSARDEMRVKEIRAFLQEAGTSEIHLVLSAVASSLSLLEAVDRFGEVGATRLLFTKLDEAAALGGILNCAVQTPHPISYLATGQDVPDNIEVAESSELGDRIIESARLGGEITIRRAA